ncbi:MAG: hypothetical protein ACE5IR_29045 [bacterium]
MSFDFAAKTTGAGLKLSPKPAATQYSFIVTLLKSARIFEGDIFGKFQQIQY